MTMAHNACPRCDGPKQIISKLCQHCHGELFGRRSIKKMRAAGAERRAETRRAENAERRYVAQFDEPSLPRFKCLEDVE